MGPVEKEVRFVTSGKRSRSQEKGHTLRLTLVPGASWYWRLCSWLVLALLISILIPRPSAALAAAAGPKAPPKPNLNVVVIGDFYSYGYATSADKTLQESAPPTLQALNQIQAANRAVQMNVLFIPVSYATSASLFLNQNAGTPALIRAVRRANVVIVGLGGGNDNLAASMRSVLFGAGAAPKSFSRLMESFENGAYLRAQIDLLNAIAAQAAPGTSIITLGYPNMLGEQLPSGFAWWSPFAWATVSQQQANMSDQLVSALDTADQQATSITAAGHSGLHFLYANLSSAMQGQGSFGSQGQNQPSTAASAPGSQPSGPTKAIISNDLVPYVNQAVNNELVAKSLPGPRNVAPITSPTPWNLAIQVPSPTRSPSPPQRRGSGPRGHAAQSKTPPPNNQNNPPYPPSSPANQLPHTGPGDQQQPGEGQPSISIPLPPPLPSVGIGVSVGVGDQGPGNQHQGGHGHHHRGSPPPAGQPAPQPQPTGTGQPSPGANPTGASGQNPGTGGQNGATPGSVGTAPGSQNSKTPLPNRITLPMIPAPPAPLPEPIAPQEPPAVASSPGADTSPSGGASGVPGNTLGATAPSGRTPGGATTPATTPAAVGATTAPATTAPATPGSPATPGTTSPASATTGSPAPATTAPATTAPATTAPATTAPATTAPATTAPATTAPATTAPATTGADQPDDIDVRLRAPPARPSRAHRPLRRRRTRPRPRSAKRLPRARPARPRPAPPPLAPCSRPPRPAAARRRPPRLPPAVPARPRPATPLTLRARRCKPRQRAPTPLPAAPPDGKTRTIPLTADHARRRGPAAKAGPRPLRITASCTAVQPVGPPPAPAPLRVPWLGLREDLLSQSR